MHQYRRIIALSLAAVLNVAAFGAAPTVDSFSSNASTPYRGQVITITATYSDTDGDLSFAHFQDLGHGNKNGDGSGPYPGLSSLIPLSGYNDTASTTFQIPTNVPTGPYTLRTQVNDSGTFTLGWLVVNVGNSHPDTATVGYPIYDIAGSLRYVSFSWDDGDGYVTYIVVFDQYGNVLDYGIPSSTPGSGVDAIYLYANVVFTCTALDNDGDTGSSSAPLFVY